jgi:DNA-directed RNA polymerase specialized sigma24 family protein
MSANAGGWDAEAERAWSERSIRIRMLAERALWHYDADATEEIIREFNGFILGLVRTIEPADREDVAQNLGELVMTVVAKGLERADNLASYTTTALRRRFLDQVRRRSRDKFRTRVGPYPEGWDPADSDAADAFEEVVDGGSVRHERCLVAIAQMKQRAIERRDHVLVQVACVIELRYLSRDLKVTEACEVLGYSPPERKLIGERISRMKANPRSEFYAVMNPLLDGNVHTYLRRNRSVVEDPREDRS